MLANPFRTRHALATGTVAVALLLAGCQATTSETTRKDASTYPDTVHSPGLTDSSITIALPGLSNQKSQDWKYLGGVTLALKKLVNELNGNGGIAGRTITPVWGFDAATGDEKTGEEVARHLCAFSVSEKPSFARQSATFAETLRNARRTGCVGPTRTVNVILDTMVDADLLAKTPDVVAPNALDDVTAAHLLVRRLTAQRFFEGARRVAVLSPTGDFAQTARDVVAADLKAAGINDPLVLAGTAGTRLTEASAKSLVLQLKAANVDRIVYFDERGDSNPFFLITSMVEQRYTPPIGTLSSAYPDDFVSYGYPAEKLSAVSWLAGFQQRKDSAATLASLPETPDSNACVNLTKATGLEVEAGNAIALLTGCTILALINEAFKASGAKEPSTAAFFTGLAKLSRFGSAFGVTLDFSRGRTGATNAWDLRGDAGCDCLRLTGGPYPIERS